MASNENGFESMMDNITSLLSVDEQLTVEVRKEAAEYFVSKLKPNIPVAKRNSKHMRDAIEVKIDGEDVQVYFEGYAFYWRFVDKGTVKQRGQHFTRRTFAQHEQKIKDIMINKIVNKMEE